MSCPTLRPLVLACAAILFALWPMVASAADGGAPSPIRFAPMTLRVWLLGPDIYLDRGRRLVVLTDNCQEPASADTDVLLGRQPDSDEPGLAFQSGQGCPVTFVGSDNAYLASGTDGGYTEVVTSQNLRTADCPDLPSVEPALVRFDLVILLGDRPSVCHLAG